MTQERMEFIKSLALEAGRLTLEGYGKCDQMPKNNKAGYYDIATVYDFRTEELVRQQILDRFGEPILGEEDGLIGDQRMARHRLWIVDPIDGTFNYQRGLPFYGVSIAYCEAGLPVCAAIYLPVLDQLFFAARGSGAFLVEGSTSTPAPIRVSQEKEMARLVISLAGSDTYRLAAACAAQGVPWRSLRFLMCAVASIAYVASGSVDLFTDASLNLWDCAAGDLVLQEAGGLPLVDYRGWPIFPETVHRQLDAGQTSGFPVMAASSPELLKEPLNRLIAAAGVRGTESGAVAVQDRQD
jgi:myo-inositol-1(or 4)-monophosphatase